MSTRLTYFIGFILICLLLLTSIYLQLVDGVMPCPLCSLQRISFGILGILFLIGILTCSKRWCRAIVNVFSLLFSVIGILLAGRQIWLQHFPPANAGECGVSLQYMIQALPPNELIQKIVEGSAECTKQGWQFFYLNMAEWALVWFSIFLLMTLYLLFKKTK